MGQESITNDKLASGRKKWPLKVSIEGNIGCGKSTLINYFKNFPEVDARLVSRLNVKFVVFINNVVIICCLVKLVKSSNRSTRGSDYKADRLANINIA